MTLISMPGFHSATLAGAPFIWDHELWDGLTELIVMASMAAHLFESFYAAESAEGSANGAPSTNRIVARCAPAVRAAMVIFYSAAAFWKFNSSFFDPVASCAPVFVMQLVAQYVPANVVPLGLTDFVVWTAPHLAAVVEVLIPLLLSQSSARPLLRPLGLALGLTFHFLIALTPPPNNAGGFSVGAVVRYFFFMPAATSVAMELLTPSLSSVTASISSIDRSSFDVKRLALIGAVAMAVTTAAGQGSVTLQGSLPIFMVVGIVYLRALYLTLSFALRPTPRPKPAVTTASAPKITADAGAAKATPAATAAADKKRRVDKRIGVCNALLLVLTAVYAYALPILGLQDIAACGMFASMHFPTAVYTGSNHFLVPTGLLQAHYEHASPIDNVFAGGVVQVMHTTSEWIRDMYPAESTMMLTPRTREYLEHAGHAAREFGPSTTRVVGTLPGMKPHADPTRPQIQYVLPAIELRRLLSEARAQNESFSLAYKRVSTTGAPFAGRIVDVIDGYSTSSSGGGEHYTRCTVRSSIPGLGTACAEDEIALLPASDWWLTQLLLAFPLPMREDGVHELGCMA